MRQREPLNSAQKAVLIVIPLFCVVLTSAVCFALDWFNANSQPMPPIYFGFIALASSPIVAALWLLRKLRLWFGFGLWLGLLVTLPWIPYNAEKRFFTAGRRIYVGMPVSEARQLMKNYDEGVTTSEDGQVQGYSYSWSDDAENDCDGVSISIQDGKVVDVSTMTD